MPSRESSLRNLEKARAHWHPPRPWRSYRETRLIKRFVWQWFTYRGPGRWSGRAVARRLGVSHTYIQKLMREFATDPTKMQREERLYGPATFEALWRAQEETRQQKERGLLREPRRWKWAEFKVGDQVVRAVVTTKASTRGPRVGVGGIATALDGRLEAEPASGTPVTRQETEEERQARESRVAQYYNSLYRPRRRRWPW